jgi:hypothetical protein
MVMAIVESVHPDSVVFKQQLNLDIVARRG